MSRMACLEQSSKVMDKSVDNSSRNNQTEEGTTSFSEAERNFKIVFYCCLFILGSLGNLMVIVVVKGKRKRTINDYFILNLAVSDLTFVWFSIPFYTYELFQTFYKNVFYCKIIWPMMSVTLSVSVFTLKSMAIERCRGIINPLQPRVKLKATLVWILFIWICAFVTMIPLIVVARPDSVLCYEKWPKTQYRKAYTAVLFALQYASPLLVIAIAYFRIAICLITSRLPMLTSQNSRGQVIRHKTRSENVQIIRTLAVIVILFMACMLPNQIAWMLFDFGGDSHKELSRAFWTGAEALIYLHACVNPIVYGSLTRQFRRGYLLYFRYVFCCRKTSINYSTGTSENLASARKSRSKRSAVVLHGSLKFRSLSEKSRTTRLEMQSSPVMSTSGESNQFGSPSPGASPIPGSTSVEMLLRTFKRQETKTLLNLSFTNSGLDVSDDEQSVQDTKL
ncbi:galanin receptor type 1-like [Oculina patagonica]